MYITVMKYNNYSHIYAHINTNMHHRSFPLSIMLIINKNVPLWAPTLGNIPVTTVKGYFTQ